MVELRKEKKEDEDNSKISKNRKKKICTQYISLMKSGIPLVLL